MLREGMLMSYNPHLGRLSTAGPPTVHNLGERRVFEWPGDQKLAFKF